MLTSFIIPLTFFVALSPWLSTCEAAEGSFCYNDSESCGPSHWAGSCNVGTRQSPISLPLLKAPDGSSNIQLTLNNYRSSAFRMQNTGHSVEFEFKSTTEDAAGAGTQGRRIFGGKSQNKTGENGGKATTPDISQYSFYRGHFHWGANDNVGSEHCYGNQCFSMELHLVHYLSSYGDINQAIASNDSNALAVIGIFLQASALSGEGSQVIAPIVKNMAQVSQPSTKESPNWYTVNSGLDFSGLLSRQNNYMYTYKGSLTTPNCNEQVNWFVMQMPVGISQNDVKAFRKVLDSHGEPMTTNHRPIQKTAGRSVGLSRVMTS